MIHDFFFVTVLICSNLLNLFKIKILLTQINIYYANASTVKYAINSVFYCS